MSRSSVILLCPPYSLCKLVFCNSQCWPATIWWIKLEQAGTPFWYLYWRSTTWNSRSCYSFISALAHL